MALQPIPDPPGFAELTTMEQVEYLQSLWDRIAADESGVPVPDSHLDLAAERLAAYRAAPGDAQPAYPMRDTAPGAGTAGR